MKYSINKDDLIKINYDLFKTLLGDHHEFYSSPGKEHYKLLSYFSKLLDWLFNCWKCCWNNGTIFLLIIL